MFFKRNDPSPNELGQAPIRAATAKIVYSLSSSFGGESNLNLLSWTRTGEFEI